MALLIVRRIGKITFYFVLSLIIARTLGGPEHWFSHDLISRVGHIIYGPGEIGAVNFYDLYFYISVIMVFSFIILNYILAMKLFNKIRKN